MRLDPKRTFDELIASLAPDGATRERVLSNRIYRELSSAVAGSQEFSAVAKLYELDRDGAFDAIVLDTPPSRNALDFLDAPGRLMRFFDGRALRCCSPRAGSRPGSPGAPARRCWRSLARLTGVDVLREITAFVAAIGGDDRRLPRARARPSRRCCATGARVRPGQLAGARGRRGGDRVRRRAARARRCRSAALVVNRVHAAAERDAEPLGARAAARRAARRARRAPRRATSRARPRADAAGARRGCASAFPALDPIVRPRARRSTLERPRRAARGRARARRRLARSEASPSVGAVVARRGERSVGGGRRRRPRTRRARAARRSARARPAPTAARRRARRAPGAAARRSRRAAARAGAPRSRARARRRRRSTLTPAITRLLERDRARDPLGRGRRACSGSRAERGEAPGKPAAARPLGLEQRAQREQVVAEALERDRRARSRARSARAPRRARPRPGAGARRGRRTRAAPPPARRASSSAPSPRPAAGSGSARHAARWPRIQASGASRCRARRGAAPSAGREARRAPGEPSPASRRARAHDRRRAVAARARRGRAAARSSALSGASSTPSRERDSADSQPMPRSSASTASSACSLGRRVELAVGGLEALGAQLEVSPARVEDAVGEAAQRVLAACGRRARARRRGRPGSRSRPSSGGERRLGVARPRQRRAARASGAR